MRKTGAIVGQAARVFWAVVHACEQHVFDRDALAGAEGEAFERATQLGQWVATTDGHQGRTLLISGGVHADGQQRARFEPTEFGDLGYQAGRGDGDTPS